MEYKLDVHTHTIASGHAFGTIDEMLRAAKQKGLSLLGITEHAKGIPGTCQDIYFRNLHVVPRERYGVQLMLGAEINILDYTGKLSMSDEFMEKYLDLCLAGIHNLCYKEGTMAENTSATVGAIEHPLVQIITHPDDARIPLDYETVVSAAKEHHVLLEVNNSSFETMNSRVNPKENYQVMLELCKKKQAPIVVNSDAHVPEAVGAREYATALLDEMEFPEELIMNRSVKAFTDFIQKNK